MDLMEEWAPKLAPLPSDVISDRTNSQHRNIKQIVGHLIDSASNNQQRMVRLQYLEGRELEFPDYYKANDTWISIQDYANMNWQILVNLLVSYNLHMAHLIHEIDPQKASNFWIDSDGTKVTLSQMAESYPKHLLLHLSEIRELINR